jgi:chromosome partitioning protein
MAQSDSSPLSSPPSSEADRIGQLAETGERMVDRLRQNAFLPESCKGLAVCCGIAEAAALLGCWTNRIRMAEEDGPLPLALPAENVVVRAIASMID